MCFPLVGFSLVKHRVESYKIGKNQKQIISLFVYFQYTKDSKFVSHLALKMFVLGLCLVSLRGGPLQPRMRPWISIKLQGVSRSGVVLGSRETEGVCLAEKEKWVLGLT